jgi:glutathione-specific gamma-glutamylcyclotransferase
VARHLRLTRELVNRLPDRIEDPGPMGRKPVPDEFYGQVGSEILARAQGGPLWVFAFGSILWKRRFAVVEERAAVVRGWHRKFCLGPDTRYRGNPAQPGVMLSLDRGGQCRGMVLRMDCAGREAALDDLLRNEPPVPPAWVRARTPEGEVQAIAFVINRDFEGYCGGISDCEVADRLASSVGMRGSMAEYLFNTITHLEAMGIHDAYLWRMQALVAERLSRLPGVGAAHP